MTSEEKKNYLSDLEKDKEKERIFEFVTNFRGIVKSNIKFFKEKTDSKVYSAMNSNSFSTLDFSDKETVDETVRNFELYY
jgi:hypothetical protein